MPSDVTSAHWLAVGLLFGLWFGYGTFLRIVFQGTLNNQLSAVRSRWLVGLLNRANGPFDAILLGHIINSTTFFGSATMIVLAATMTLMSSAGATHGTMQLLLGDAAPSFGLYMALMLVLNVTLAISFFAFIYALRKLIYVIALIGALPPLPEDEGLKAEHSRMAKAAAGVLSSALITFNFGIRGYYYFVAAIGLFVSPWVSIGLSLFFTLILIYRQVASQAADQIGRYVEASEAYAEKAGRL